LGTFGLSGDAYGAVEPAVQEAVIRRALDVGITLFETSDAYGAGQMEALLGKVLKGHSAVVVTRGGLDRSTDPPRKRFDRSFLRDRILASCKRLERDAVPVYLLHNPSPDALAIGECVQALQDFKDEGLIQHWGVSAGDDIVAKMALDAGAEVLSMTYNLMHGRYVHRVAGDLMVTRAGLLAHSPLAYGLLAGLWPKDKEFPEGDTRRNRWTRLELETRIDHLNAVRFLVHGDVHTMRAAATRFVLANHMVSSLVLGPKSVEQLEQLVRETGGGPRYLPDGDLAELPRALERVGIPT
jgi:aryl-alcohol dehydrogenase-like predicted oxidoreductase